MQFKKFITLTTLLIILITQTVLADEYASINTSRPGAANPTSSVPFGLYQFEIGTNLTTNQGADTAFTIPTLLRMGIYKNTELQVAYISQYLTLGVLYGGISIIDGLENSIIFTTSMTQNNDSLTEYSTYFPISYKLNNDFSVWGQASGTVINTDSSNPVISYSLAIGKSLGEKTSWFLETYQSIIKDQDDPPISIDGGFTYLSDKTVQFDISMGVTFDKIDNTYKESSRFIEWGFSFRKPH